eukprot:5083441-Prymnesium_polylepis.1
MPTTHTPNRTACCMKVASSTFSRLSSASFCVLSLERRASEVGPSRPRAAPTIHPYCNVHVPHAPDEELALLPLADAAEHEPRPRAGVLSKRWRGGETLRARQRVQ